MTNSPRVKLMGMPVSPYTRKMLAILRYRHIPYEFIVGMPAMQTTTDLPKAKVLLLPTFYLPDADGKLEALTDSTPLIRRFEAEHAGRSVIPSDPVVAFVNDLIEDYADEWLTKSVMHYRWSHPENIANAQTLLPLEMQISLSNQQVEEIGQQFGQRQISRRSVVGSNEITAPIIENSYQRLLDLLNEILQAAPYVMGQRPGSADFALYGQLTALTHFDPTPMATALDRAPRVYAWVELMEDQSGVQAAEDGWWARNAMPAPVQALLSEIGRVYVPAMLANAKALMNGDEQVETEIDGQRWTQQPFPYQGKCLQWLATSYAELSTDDQQAVNSLLQGTGCEALFK